MNTQYQEQSVGSSSQSWTRVDLAVAWVYAHNHWQLNSLHDMMTDATDFDYQYAPSDIGLGPKTKPEFISYNTQMKSILPDFTVNLIRVSERTSGGPVIVQVIGRATSQTGVVFATEFTMFIHVREESGVLKIHRVIEQVDFEYLNKFFSEERIRRRALNVGLRSRL